VTAYFDTSALAAAYVTEAHSRRARQALQRQKSIPFTPLHGLELRNAFELLVGRAVLSAAERTALMAHLEEDRQEGRLVQTSVEWDAVFAKAGELSIAHTRKRLTRSLDLLHLASAVELGCRTFVSGDQRQLKVARALRLRTIDIARPTRPAAGQLQSRS
jgi:predicted nucleic acid-binding protein